MFFTLQQNNCYNSCRNSFMFIGQEPLSMIKIMPDIANSALSRPSVQVLPHVQGLETDARDLKAY